MKIHIMGASCAGSTTLGLALAQQMMIPYFDTDSYFWEESTIPYTIRRDPDTRGNMLANDLGNQSEWILGGSVITWGDSWLNAFDLVVFLYIPHDIRIQRLKQREFERYGDAIVKDAERAKLCTDFISWASGYDDNTTQGRNLLAHQTWIKSLNCKVLIIDGDTTVAQRLDRIITEIDRFG